MNADRLERLESAVLDYIERYGLTDKARECFSRDKGQEDENARSQPGECTESSRPTR